jgi:uncharacterized membrane protein
MTHNLFGSSYFGQGDWTGRYFVLSVAIAILLATLLFAFPLREANKALPGSGRRGKVISYLLGRPEQLQFFIPVILVMAMLALKTSEGMITVSWGIEGLLVALVALFARERSYLLAGFGILSICIVKVFAMDIWRFDLAHKVIVFIGVGLAAVAVSILYYMFGDRLRQYL